MLTFEELEQLPFADGTFATTPKVQQPIQFELAKDGRKVTIFPVHDVEQVPRGLLDVIHEEVNFVIDEGLTYPYYQTVDYAGFVKMWFSAFVAILVEGHHHSLDEVEGPWKPKFLGTFYVKPNYAGRCSHVCNAGFIVNHEKRGLGLGKELGRKYLDWAPQLGYVYSVFNLVFETNVASLKIWESLGFERIGYVKNVAVLKGIDRLVGAYQYGYDFGKR